MSTFEVGAPDPGKSLIHRYSDKQKKLKSLLLKWEPYLLFPSREKLQHLS